MYKKIMIITGLTFFIFLSLQDGISFIENSYFKSDQYQNIVYNNKINELNEENQKLRLIFQEIYQPYNEFISCKLAMHNPETSLNNKVTTQDIEIFYLQSRHLKGKTPVQIKKTVYNPQDCPKNYTSTNSSKIILISVHGTMSSWQVFGYGKSASSLAIQRFATEISQIYGQKVELLVINWGGELSQKRRLKVGLALGDYIAHQYQKNDKIWGIGHSHGCNVLNNLAERLRTKNIKADKFLCIAPIALDIKPNHLGLNIDECYNFYSCGDVIQAAGSSQNGSNDCVRFFPQCPQTQSYCIQVFPNNEEVDHLTIKIVVLEQLSKLICQIKKIFRYLVTSMPYYLKKIMNQ